ncbi:MAG: 23S rRNA (pseudouridine(1915)-N(3))-methyltransferase RlmH [Clostridia bacterium]|nr:23S rRNA (pseudouridine(1915)-N(3))-methyltransferase RlmH [Clostridia bacterium]
MGTITILCIGKLKEAYWRDAMAEYTKRLSGFCKFNVVELDETKASDHPSEKEIATVIEKEGDRILAKIPTNALVIALCIEGKSWSSEELASYIATQSVNGVSHIVFLIGGSYGLSPRVKQQAQIKLSFSKMTFPHQLFRVLLTEQIYRAFQINNQSPYHK